MPSKRYKKLPEKTKDLSAEAIEKLLPEVKKNCTTKFDESVDLSFQINNKQKKSEVNIRTVVNLPGGTGKKVKVAVVCEDAKAQEAKDAGGDLILKSNFLSLYTVISTGTGFPAIDLVLSLKALQNSIMLTPRWPKAGPTGGAGFACPPLICNFINPLISFAINLLSQLGYILNLLVLDVQI